MKKLIVASANFSKLDAINAGNGRALQDLDDGASITIAKLAVMEDTDTKTGEVKQVGVIITKDGDVCTTISQSVIESIDTAITCMNEGTEISTFTVSKRVSKGGRDFLTVIVG